MNGSEHLVVGAERLLDLYGYRITFHDALVESFLIERGGPSVTIRFATNDLTTGGRMPDQSNLLAHVVLRWREVADLELRGIGTSTRDGNWINGLEIEREGSSIRTAIEIMAGFHGSILATSIEVV